MSLPVPHLTKNAVRTIVCNSGPDVPTSITINDPMTVQVVGWITTEDDCDTICLSDGDFSYPFLIQEGIRERLSPYCTISIKQLAKHPFEDPNHPGVNVSVFVLLEMDVVIQEYGVIIGIPDDLRKALFDFDCEYPLANHWDSSWHNEEV
jgi:hypothetical protein